LVLFQFSTVEAKTRSDFDPEARFSAFKTFAFVAGIDLGKTGLMDDPDTRTRIANFVSGILETRGLQEVPRDQKHDVAVRVWIALRDRYSETTISSGNYWGGYDPFWYGPWGYWYEETVIHDYKGRTLIIDLLNPATKQLVWRTYLKRDFKDRAKAYDQAGADAAIQLQHQVEHHARGAPVEVAGGLVGEDQPGIGDKRACDSNPLLLSAGNGQRRFFQIVFHLIPQC
jgi:hypothetical protein